MQREFSELDVVQSYLEAASPDVFENANKYPGPTGLLSYVAEKRLMALVRRVFPDELYKLHVGGVIHVHKLPHSLFIPYCSGHSVERLLVKGLRTPTITAFPAKHMDTFSDHVANYLMTMQHYFSGAQAFGAVELYAGPFIRRENLSYKQVKQNVQRMIFNLNFPSRTGMQCLSEDTQILTPEGWKSYKEVRVGDLIYTFNTKTREIEVKRVRHVFVREYKGKMYNLRNRTQDQLVSPGHRIVWKAFNKDEIRYEPIENLLGYRSPIPLPTPAFTEFNGKDYDVSDDEIRVVAWILSEGSIDSSGGGTPRVTIVQSEKGHLSEILELLERLNLRYEVREDPGWGSAKAVRLDAESSRRVLDLLGNARKKPPAWIYRLSRRQARLFLETYVKGDGWVERENDDKVKRVRITTTDPEIRDALVALAVLAGYNVSVIERNPSPPSKKVQYIISLTETELEYIQEIKEVEYEGVIWSVNTENETVIAKRKGCVFITGNTPFTNFTIVLDASRKKLDGDDAIVGGERVGVLGEYLEEAKMFVRAVYEIHGEGDASGRPFTFPIPTIMTTSKMLYEDPEVFEAVFKASAKKGTGYWLNTRIVDPDSSYAMCCRINIDARELMHANKVGGLRMTSMKREVEEAREEYIKRLEKTRMGGLWAIPDITGSKAVITVNLPRLVLDSNKDDEAFKHLLDSVLMKVRAGLVWMAERYYKLSSRYKGFYSMVHTYVPEVFSLVGTPFFLTIGLIGLPEAAAMMEGDPKAWVEGSRRQRLRMRDWMARIVSYVVDEARKWSKSTGYPFNVEEVPGESAAVRLASIDASLNKEVLEYLPEEEEPVYSTSITPYYADLSLWERVEIEEKIQPLFTGGVMMHIFLGEEPDPEALARLTRRLTESTSLVYWSYTPAVTVCPKCGWSGVGMLRECPRCGSETEIWSRIIGYYRPLKNWNPARRKEFWTRKHIIISS